MEKRIIATAEAPKAIGPYSQAVEVSCGKLIFCSGQIPIDPQTQELLLGSVEEQTRRVLTNLKAVLAAAGCTFENVVKTTIFLRNLGDFSAVNSVYAESFVKNPPARATVEVARLPKDAAVEIDCIAVK
jgi:2-iminobutanoate/2-iminopropanoate deaminase